MTSRADAPGAAAEPTVTLSVSCPQALTVVDVTVIPAFANCAAAPLAKFEPAMVSESVRPASAAEGVAEVTTGRDQPWI